MADAAGGCCLLSGMAVAFVKYESRKLFTEMERLRVQRDELGR